MELPKRYAASTLSDQAAFWIQISLFRTNDNRPALKYCFPALHLPFATVPHFPLHRRRHSSLLPLYDHRIWLGLISLSRILAV
jgi:hypothetical protein